MALTYTPPGELNSPCPDFSLPSVDGNTYTLGQFSGQCLVIMFICNHCPYVQAIEDRLIQLAREMGPCGVQFIGICSNDPDEYPEDSFESLKQRWLEKNYGFPYLFDESQKVAKAFGAVCTPDFFVYDRSHKLAYRGRLDDSWKDARLVQKQELKEALESILTGKEVSTEQFPSMEIGRAHV